MQNESFKRKSSPFMALPEEFAALIRDELNIKELEFPDDPSPWVDVSLKPNFRILGPRFGKKLGLISKALNELSSDEIFSVLFSEKECFEIEVEGEKILLDKKNDVETKFLPKPGMAVASDGEVMIVLDTQLTPELVREGIARELVNRIQNLRKKEKLEVADRIRLVIAAEGEIAESAKEWKRTISDETLAVDLRIVPQSDAPESSEKVEIDKNVCYISIKKARDVIL